MRSSHHPTIRLLLALLLTGAAALALAASPALAVRGHVFSETFASPGSAAGQLEEAEGPAVNEATGNVYIADRGNNRVDVFTAAGVFLEAWGWGVKDAKEEFEVCTSGSGCQAGLPGAGEGQFTKPSRIAVDNACALHGLTEASKPQTCKQFDPSDGDVYVETGPFGSQVVDKFTSAGVFLGVIAGPPAPEPGAFTGGVEGVAVDAAGTLWILEQPGHAGSESEGADSYTNAAPNAFGGFVELRILSQFDQEGLAVDGSNHLFVHDGQREVVEFDGSGHPVQLQPDGLPAPVGGEEHVGFNGVAVEQLTGDVYLDVLTGVGRFGPFEAGVGNPLLERFGEAALAAAPCVRNQSEAACRGGVAVDSVSGAVFVSVGSEGRVVRFVLEPPGVPVVQDQSVSGVTSGAARVSGEVNPRSEPEPVNGPTTYFFEYTPVERFAVEGWAGASRTPAGGLAASYVLSGVSAELVGLSPGTAYRYRLLAENQFGVTSGEAAGGSEVARTFTTEPAAGFGLLDRRGWEMVSPPVKLGALFTPVGRFGEFPIQAAAGGGAVTYVASSPTEAGVAGNARVTQVLSARGASGWVSRDLSLPHERPAGLSEHPEFPAFSSDLSLAAAQPLGPFEPALSPAASEQTAYTRSNFVVGGGMCVEGCFSPLVSAANAPGVEFGLSETNGEKTKDEACPPLPFCGPQFEAASPDMKHVVVHSSVALTEGAPSTGGLFEISEGAITFLGTGELGDPQEFRINLLADGEHTVSADGSRVVMTGQAGGLSGLLVRDSVTEETLKLGGPAAVFVAASADDSRVFYEELTGGPLEECRVIEEPEGAMHCETADVSHGATAFAPLPGVSDDGSAVYFVSAGVIAGAVPAPDGETPQAGQPNLYLSREGNISLLAVLSNNDNSDWGEGKIRSPKAAFGALSARSSPDGRWLAFLSTSPLTGYDNTDAKTGTADDELFLYHAAGGSEPASLVCASCDPTGARPTGGASVPAWTTAQYQSRYLSNGGRLFFNTPGQLVPQDTNKTTDVYEYEPSAGTEAPASDNCTTTSAAYDASAAGCVDLISSGSSPEPSTFLDASENGDEVFFLTAAQLSKRDTDTSYDVYDARVEGSEPEPVKPVECNGDDCQTPVAPPENLTPGSLTFTGPGNLLYTPPVSKPAVKKKKIVKCRRGFVKDRKGRCVGRKSKSKQAKKSNRRARS